MSSSAESGSSNSESGSSSSSKRLTGSRPGGKGAAARRVETDNPLILRYFFTPNCQVICEQEMTWLKELLQYPVFRGRDMRLYMVNQDLDRMETTGLKINHPGALVAFAKTNTLVEVGRIGGWPMTPTKDAYLRFLALSLIAQDKAYKAYQADIARKKAALNRLYERNRDTSFVAPPDPNDMDLFAVMGRKVLPWEAPL